MRAISSPLVVAFGMLGGAVRASEAVPPDLAAFCERNVGIFYDMPIEDIRAVAPILGEIVTNTTSVHDPLVQIEVHQFYFEGLYVSIGAWSGRVVLDQIKLDSTTFEMPLGIRLGVSSPSDIERILGTQQMYPPEESTRRYACDSTWESTVTFAFEDERLSAVHWAYYFEL